ncbi:MAG: DUF4158 domain-containing protein [Chloroflexi bacterium]|nr:DUF4158 domain-containing protein [Chloroflexota bacterium]MBV9601349.1 DUF4158 domain-containing protein [Chloroflexota bacterium]
MPVRLFTDAERERLNRFPRDIPPADLLAFFTLSDDELDFIGDRRGDHNRVGFGLQLKALPYLGFVPDDLGGAPARVVSYLALQLSVSSEALQQYGDREHTRTDHLQEIQNRLGFRDAGQRELAVLNTWLLDRALEHDRPIVLFHLACQWLLQERLVRPGVTRIERLVAGIRERAQQETYRRLGTLLTPTLRDGLDAVLQPSSGRRPMKKSGFSARWVVSSSTDRFQTPTSASRSIARSSPRRNWLRPSTMPTGSCVRSTTITLTCSPTDIATCASSLRRC